MLYIDKNLNISYQYEIYKRNFSFYNLDTIESKYITNCIGISISTSKHVMCFYKCGGKELFCNCLEENKIIEFKYEDMFKNIGLLNEQRKEFRLQCNPTNYECPFIIDILVNENNHEYKKADTNTNIVDYDLKMYKDVIDFKFIMLENL